MSTVYPETVTTLLGRNLPEAAVPAGYAALIAAYHLPVQPPDALCAIGQRHVKFAREGWRFFTPRHAPKSTLEGHLTFALKHEGIDLAILDALFRVVEPLVVCRFVENKPTGKYTRRIWFLYEWLTQRELPLPSLKQGTYVCAIDPAMQFAGRAVNSARHRVRDNLPGPREFCPLVFKSPALLTAMEVDFPSAIRRVFDETPEKFRPFVWFTLANWEARPKRGGDKPRSVLGQWRRGTLHGGLRLTVEEIAILTEKKEADILLRHPQMTDMLEALATFALKSVGVLPVPLVAACLAFGFAIGSGVTDPFEGVHRYFAQKYFAHNAYRAGDWMVPISPIAHNHKLKEYERLLAAPYARGLFNATPHVSFYYACISEALLYAVPPAVKAAPALYDREMAMANA